MVKKEKDKFNNSDETVFRISASQALRVAEMQVEKYKQLKEWHDAYAVKVFPLFSRLDKEEPSYFEVKISTPSVDDAGTVIISATDKDFPIIGFRTRGRTLTEKVILKSGHGVERIVWHGLNAVVGEDKTGKEIISLGHKPEKIFDLDKYEEVRKKRKEKPLPKPLPEPQKSKELQEEWNEVKKALGLIESNPYGVTADSFSFAWGWSRHANLDQYELSNGEKVGCGPTAWSALLAYHDMYWDPDFLYGTHYYMSDYIKRSMKKFHDKMKTDDGSTTAWNIKKGFDIFKDYHCFGSLHFDPDDYSEWDWDVCVLGAEPGEAIQNLILNMINVHTPVIVGLVTDTSWVGYQTRGHYCLGFAWAKNANGKLKYVLCDELHGEGQDDLMWWHRDTIFGAWGIPRGSYDRPRQAVESNIWSEIDLANFGDEIYAVGRKRPEAWPDPNPVFLIQRGSAKGFPIPEKGTAAKKLEFDESVEIPFYDLQGSDVYPLNPSITTWNYKTTTYHIEVTTVPVMYVADSTEERERSDELTLEELRRILSERPSTGTIRRLKAETSELPYLFLVWADFNSRIHIAYTVIPENLEEISFTHVLLPERFMGTRPDIAIAQDDKTGPMLYIAYCDSCFYFHNNQLYYGWGRVLIINLALFFQIVETGEDLWPIDSLPNLRYVTETVEVQTMGGPMEVEQNVLTDFKWYWVPFSANVANVRLSSNGKQVALLWWEAYYDKLNIHWSYTFESTIQVSGGYPGKAYWGDCDLNIAYAKYGSRFLSHSSHVKTEGDYWIGDIKGMRCDVFYGSDNWTLVVWSDPDNRLLIAKVTNHSNPRRAELLADFFRTGSEPRLAFVKDELDNRNTIMTFSFSYESQLYLVSRILYLSGSYVPGIKDFDDLPK
jgi:hypothetical protein